MLHTISSPDGTKIAYDQQGEGPTLILVDGALTVHSAGRRTGQAARAALHRHRVRPARPRRERRHAALRDRPGDRRHRDAHRSHGCRRRLPLRPLLRRPASHARSDQARRQGRQAGHVRGALQHRPQRARVLAPVPGRARSSPGRRPRRRRGGALHAVHRHAGGAGRGNAAGGVLAAAGVRRPDAGLRSRRDPGRVLVSTDRPGRPRHRARLS